MTNYAKHRKEKDDFFARSHQSPITHEDRHDFKGLNYFEEDASLNLILDIDKFENPISVDMQTTTGDMKTFKKLGTVSFAVDGSSATLTVFSSEHGLFLPFVDSQAGKETYGAGRYLDPPLLLDGKVEVDFNLAYNPFCAYNEAYSCPLPPAENRIAVAIKAGEKNFK